MIIPIRCFSCNKLIADKYSIYLDLNKKLELDNNLTTIDTNLINSGAIETSAQGKILDELNIKRYCCRRMFLTQVDIVDVI
jgi:DNA-directed RNA polymerase subunit N (RpoN/RPB10)